MLILVKKLIKDRNELGLTKFDLKTSNLEKMNYDDKTVVIYQCVQEGKMILKHSKADSAHVSIDAMDYFIEIKIKDNGIGITQRSFDTRLDGMQEAVESVAGDFNISSFKNNGTTLKLKFLFKFLKN